MIFGDFYILPMWMGIVCSGAAMLYTLYAHLFPGRSYSDAGVARNVRLGAWLGLLFELLAWLMTESVYQYNEVATKLQWGALIWMGLFLIGVTARLILSGRRSPDRSRDCAAISRTSIWCALFCLILGYLLHSNR